MEKEKRVRGRPVRPMPAAIPDTPANIARTVLNAPPKKRDEWRFIKERKQLPEETG